MKPRVVPGLEIFASNPSRWIKPGERAGLLYNSASVASDYSLARDVVRPALGDGLTALFGPQHGVDSDVQDNMIETGHAVDSKTGLPVWSLYGETRKPTARMLEGIDVLLVDLVDVGTRVYTFMWTLKLAMDACAEKGVRVIVLDRPNPIGGLEVEGNVLEPEFSSFVGLLPIPMRHGMTMGELALYFKKTACPEVELTVVRAEGWERRMHHPETGLPWAMPSPNMPSWETALVYPGTVLLEGTSASEGRGTTRPFEIIGSPHGKPGELAEALSAENLPGVHFRPLVFMPTFHKGGGLHLNGTFIHVTCRDSFRPYLTGLAVLGALWRLYAGKGFRWRDPPYEYEEVEKPIHLLLGSRRIREEIERGTPVRVIWESWTESLDEWKRERETCLIY